MVSLDVDRAIELASESADRILRRIDLASDLAANERPRAAVDSRRGLRARHHEVIVQRLVRLAHFAAVQTLAGPVRLEVGD